MSAFALMSAPAASAIAISNNGDVTSVTDIRFETLTMLLETVNLP